MYDGKLSSIFRPRFNSGTNLTPVPSDELGREQWSPSTALRKSASNENLSPQRKDEPDGTGDVKADDRDGVGAAEHPAG